MLPSRRVGRGQTHDAPNARTKASRLNRTGSATRFFLIYPKGVDTPTYDYYCHLCLATFEAVKRLNEDTTTTSCPTCGARSAKQASAPALKFNGKGWTPKHYPKK